MKAGVVQREQSNISGDAIRENPPEIV